MSSLTVQNIQGSSSSSNTINVASGPKISGAAGSIVAPGQVIQTVTVNKTDTFTTSSSSFVDITGMAATITPSSTNSKILILGMLNGSQDVGANRAYVKLLRGDTAICIGDASGSRIRGLGGFSSNHSTLASSPLSYTFLDTPSTTSATTYKLQIASTAGSGTCFVNRTDTDADDGQIRMASTIVLQEIAG